jgi:hypothetical protein
MSAAPTAALTASAIQAPIDNSYTPRIARPAST